MTRSDRLLEDARRDPKRVLDEGQRYLDGDASITPRERAIALRAMSIAARIASDLDRAIRLAEESADVAEEAGESDLRWEAVLTLAGCRVVGGDRDAAMSLIDEALASCTNEHLCAKFLFQRGYVRMVSGELRGGRDDFRAALPIFSALEDRPSVLLTLQNLGQLGLSSGDLEDAEGYLSDAERLAQEIGDRTALAGILHDLGLLASYRGDIPLAIERLTQSDELTMSLSGTDAPQHVARAEVLISAGLYNEALTLAETIVDRNRRLQDGEHLGNALVVASRAAVLSGSPRAVALADETVRELRDQGRTVRLAEAMLTLAIARAQQEGPSLQLLKTTEQASRQLRDEGLTYSAAQADLLLAGLAGDLGEPIKERAALERVAEIESGPFEVRLQGRVARARLALRRGDRGGAWRSARSGLKVLDSYQSSVGASDLRLGLERHAAELGDIGLGLAYGSGGPRRTLEWLEMTRARALRYRSMRSSSDSELDDRLADLRRLEGQMRRSDAPDLVGMRRRRRRLQDDIAALDRARQGTTVDDDRVFSIRTLAESLERKVLVEIGELQGTLFAVVVRGGRASMVELGGYQDVADEIRHVRFGMRRDARRGRSARADATTRLDDLLLSRVRLGDDPVIIVPPPPLMAVPWAGLSSLRGRPLVVTPSAEMWWRAGERVSRRKATLVASGPDLKGADDEVRRVRALYPKSALDLTQATVEQVKQGAEGIRTAHIACHASFSYENPMFSSLRLADGDLNVYDIERLQHAPEVVVLSACDSGYTETRAGDELAGLTSALLNMGTRSVVASIGLVPDNVATTELMVDLHKGLVAGRSPSEALAAAQAKAFQDPDRFVSAASFVCVGA